MLIRLSDSNEVAPWQWFLETSYGELDGPNHPTFTDLAAVLTWGHPAPHHFEAEPRGRHLVPRVASTGVHQLMLSCWVYFYRTIFGVQFAVPQGRIEIRSARDEARAIEAAKRKFARRQNVLDWRLRADRFDVVCPKRDGSSQLG